ncbi:MAG: type II secretion system minor pseudopilin GspJ [Thiobacillaceae bacterium]
MRAVRGFTLLEVLVALVLLTVFAVMAYRALNSVLDAQRQATAKMDNLNELAAAFTLMDSDLSNTTARVNPQNPGDSGFHILIGQDGSEQFDFVRLLPEDADQGLQRIGYRCAGATLSRLVWADVNNPVDTPKETALLGGLRSCAFKYLSAGGQQWLAAWLPQTGISFPPAIELTVIEADGTPIRRVVGVQ